MSVAAESPVSRSSRPLGAVLAGGRGRRIGGSKAERPMAGLALIAYPLRALHRAGLDACVVAKPGFEVPRAATETAGPVEVVLEPERPTHPLLGIVTALEHAGGRPVLALACDMPFLSPELLTSIASHEAALAVPRVTGRLEPLVARYEPSLLPELRAGLEAEAALTDVVERLGPTVIEEDELIQFGDPSRLFLNINTEADLERAASMPKEKGFG